MPLKTASLSSHRVPRRYIRGRVPGWRGQARQGNAYPGDLSGGHGRWWGQPRPVRSNEYPKVSLSAKAVIGALYFPPSPHKHTDLVGQIPTTLPRVWSIFGV